MVIYKVSSYEKKNLCINWWANFLIELYIMKLPLIIQYSLFFDSHRRPINLTIYFRNNFFSTNQLK